jgi:hypothetical protein
MQARRTMSSRQCTKQCSSTSEVVDADAERGGRSMGSMAEMREIRKGRRLGRDKFGEVVAVSK